MADTIILIGLSGAGKTSTAKLLAERLNFACLDSDQSIEEKTGLTISELFKQQGEAEFRTLENQWLQNLDSSADFEKKRNQGRVIACGGGLPITPGNIEKLNCLGTTIYLQAGEEILAQRIGQDQSRPLLSDTNDIVVKIKTMLASRRKLYEQAHLTIDTNHKSVPEVADEIQRILTNTTL